MVFFFPLSLLSVVEMAFSVPIDGVTDRVRNSVGTYMNGVAGRVYFDARRFRLMCCRNDDNFIFDAQMHEDRLTGAGG